MEDKRGEKEELFPGTISMLRFQDMKQEQIRH